MFDKVVSSVASDLSEAAQELKEKVFKGKKVKSLQPAPDGQGRAGHGCCGVVMCS